MIRDAEFLIADLELSRAAHLRLIPDAVFSRLAHQHGINTERYGMLGLVVDDTADACPTKPRLVLVDCHTNRLLHRLDVITAADRQVRKCRQCNW